MEWFGLLRLGGTDDGNGYRGWRITTVRTSPFSRLPRYEAEKEHLYVLPSEFRRQLEDDGSLFILGSRGTGKTTLLKSLSWSERISNEFLQRALGVDIFDSRIIGTYHRLAEARLTLFEWWRSSQSIHALSIRNA